MGNLPPQNFPPHRRTPPAFWLGVFLLAHRTSPRNDAGAARGEQMNTHPQTPQNAPHTPQRKKDRHTQATAQASPKATHSGDPEREEGSGNRTHRNARTGRSPPQTDNHTQTPTIPTTWPPQERGTPEGANAMQGDRQRQPFRVKNFEKTDFTTTPQ